MKLHRESVRNSDFFAHCGRHYSLRHLPPHDLSHWTHWSCQTSPGKAVTAYSARAKLLPNLITGPFVLLHGGALPYLPHSGVKKVVLDLFPWNLSYHITITKSKACSTRFQFSVSCAALAINEDDEKRIIQTVSQSLRH